MMFTGPNAGLLAQITVIALVGGMFAGLAYLIITGWMFDRAMRKKYPHLHPPSVGKSTTPGRGNDRKV